MRWKNSRRLLGVPVILEVCPDSQENDGNMKVSNPWLHFISRTLYLIELYLRRLLRLTMAPILPSCIPAPPNRGVDIHQCKTGLDRPKQGVKRKVYSHACESPYHPTSFVVQSWTSMAVEWHSEWP